jgi:hypothetical protein
MAWKRLKVEMLRMLGITWNGLERLGKGWDNSKKARNTGLLSVCSNSTNIYAQLLSRGPLISIFI